MLQTTSEATSDVVLKLCFHVLSTSDHTPKGRVMLVSAAAKCHFSLPVKLHQATTNFGPGKFDVTVSCGGLSLVLQNGHNVKNLGNRRVEPRSRNLVQMKPKT